MNEVGSNTNNTRESEPTIPIKVIPPFRLLVSAAYSLKHYNASKISPDDVKNDNAFKTVKDFIRKFETVLKHYNVNVDKNGLRFVVFTLIISLMSCEITQKILKINNLTVYHI
ncbi:hypothetical protein G6F64_014823 [Rhizopus arrhizus]|uniref:Uncharacterized protein n=1 Tax=Rhizopus oryzae TaxID=64495 RepID=A0A9P7BJF9_RHIOR|nr:hypothetical protein G6F64_014823 [Rhizopus arrhizus]